MTGDDLLTAFCIQISDLCKRHEIFNQDDNDVTASPLSQQRHEIFHVPHALVLNRN